MNASIFRNKVKTGVVMTLIFALLYVVVYYVSYALGCSPRFAMFIGIGISFAFSFISYWKSDSIALASCGAKEVAPNALPQVRAILERLTRNANLPEVPKLYITEDSAPNAFATGRNPRHCAVCVTRGMLNYMNEKELEGVLAHELSHIKNYDILLQTVAGVTIGAAIMIARIYSRTFFYGGGRRRSNNNSGSANAVFLIIGLVFVIVSPIAGQMLKLLLSRNREYLADATGAKIAGTPLGLASALEKLSQIGSAVPAASNATESMFISNPLKKTSFSELFSTHPPLEKRIARLREMD